MPVKAHITNPEDGMIAEVKDVLDGKKRLYVAALIDAESQLPIKVNIVQADPVNLVAEYAKNGSAFNMKVNGSVTPRVFTYAAHPTLDILALELRFVFAAASFNWSGIGFGKNASAGLTNGILIEMIINDGTTLTLNNVTINEDFLRTFGEVPVVDSAGSTVVLVSSYRFGGSNLYLKAGTSDRVQVTVRDDLTGGGLGVNYLTATFFGSKAVA